LIIAVIIFIADSSAFWVCISLILPQPRALSVAAKP
jgi:hypothetical protein